MKPKTCKKSGLLVFLALFFVLLSCATRFKSEPKIHNGAKGRHSQQLGRSSALLILTDNPEQPELVRFCSGVAVSPVHILTAAHCLYRHKQTKSFFFPALRPKPTKEPLKELDIAVFFTEKLDYILKDSPQQNRAARREVQSFWINDTYKSSQRVIDTSIDLTWGNWVLYPSMNDIALLTLSRRIPTPLVPADLPEQDATFETARATFLMTGYGVQGLVPHLGKTGDLLFFSFTSLPDPRVDFNIVYKPKKNLFVFDAFRSAVPCDGDSGGPLFRHDPSKDKPELVALFSASPSDSGLCSSKGLAFTTVSGFTTKLRCVSGSSLSQQTQWEMTPEQRQACTNLKIAPPALDPSMFSQPVEDISAPTASEAELKQFRFFDDNLLSGCNADQIKKAYIQLAKTYHPDLFQDPAKQLEAEDIMKEVNRERDLIEELCSKRR